MTASNRTTVVGVFERREDADRAVDELRRAGFRDDDIGFAVRGGEVPEGTTDVRQAGAGEGAATGFLTGGVIGGLVGAAASGLIPGVGPVVAGGILASVLGGAAVGAAAGGLLGALMGLGVPEEEARYYEGEFQAGRTLVTVKAGDRFAEANDMLRSHGAYDIRESASAGDSLSATPTSGDASHAGTDATATERFVAYRTPEMEAPAHSSGIGHSWDEVEPTYRDAWERQHGMSGRRWHEEEAGYRFGYEMSQDGRFQHRNWDECEPELRQEFDDWSQRHGYQSSHENAWEHARVAARGTWESLRQHARA